MEVALINGGATNAESFAFWWRAIETQMARDFLPAWRGHLPIPEAEQWPIVGYRSAVDVKPGSTHLLVCVDSIEDASVLGDHSGWRASGLAFGRWKADPSVASHEVLELIADPFCDVFKPLPGRDGDTEAMEVCDRVESDLYPIDVTIAGIPRTVMVSNFLWPEAFGIVTPRSTQDGHRRQYDHMGLLTRPDENRGYRIVKGLDGSITNEFADRMDAAAREKVIAKLGDPRSRAAQRRDGRIVAP